MAMPSFVVQRPAMTNEALPLEVKIEVPNRVILFNDSSAPALPVLGNTVHPISMSFDPRSDCHLGVTESETVKWGICGTQLRHRRQIAYTGEEVPATGVVETNMKVPRWTTKGPTASKRSSESADRQRVVDRERKRRRRENETPEEAEERRARDRERKRRSRQNETPEKAALRRAIAREKKRLKLKNETPEEAERRRALDRENKRIVRQRATAEKKEHWLAIDRGRKRLLRQNQSRLLDKFEDCQGELDWQNIPGVST